MTDLASKRLVANVPNCVLCSTLGYGRTLLKIKGQYYSAQSPWLYMGWGASGRDPSKHMMKKNRGILDRCGAFDSLMSLELHRMTSKLWPMSMYVKILENSRPI